jgi:hypothetical protein
MHGNDLPAEKLLFNQGEVASALRLSRHQVALSIRDGSLPTKKVGAMRYVTRAALLRFRQQLYDEPGDPSAGRAA